MNCSCCGKQKHSLTTRRSKLKKSQELYMCQDCIINEYEPRWLIIIVGRTLGMPAVSKYITRKLYPGEKILAEDLVL